MVFTYYDISSGGKRPENESEYIAPGQKIRGYITYVSHDKPYVVYYQDRKIMVKIERQ